MKPYPIANYLLLKLPSTPVTNVGSKGCRLTTIDLPMLAPATNNATAATTLTTVSTTSINPAMGAR